jgi:PAS domain S-box-containing protein
MVSAASAAAGILWVGLTVEDLHGALLWLGFAVFALVAVRQALTHRENLSLTGALEARIATSEASEAELRRRERQLAEAQALARLGSWEIVIGVDWVEASPGLYEIFRLDPLTFQPTLDNFEKLVHPDDRATLQATIDAAMAGGVAGSAELRFQVPGGDFIWVHACVQAVRSADGDIIGIRGTSQDITARRASDEALRASEERLRNIVESSPVAIIEFDTAKIVRVWNPAAETLYGWTRQEMEGRPPPFADPGGEDGFDALFRRTLAGEHIHNVEVVRQSKDEQTLHVSVSMAPIRDDGGDIIGVASAGIDITHQRRLEAGLRQAQKMEAIGRLAGAVAHDFNNLLTVIVAYGELLLDELDAEGQVGQQVGAMHAAALRAAALTDQLLTFSRRHVVTGEPADLSEVVGSLRPILERLVGDQITLEIRLAPGALCVAADRMQVQEILLNLIVNAREAMPGGGILTITTSSAAASAGPTTAVLRVADTGSGMDEGTRDQIFEPFFSTKAEHVGTGLGLSAVYGIVRQHGGNVSVASVPDAGSIFTISLPLVPSAATTSGEPGGVAPIEAARVGTVLVVEDEPAVRLLAREVLELQGHVVIAAADGAEALDLAAAHAGRIDVLLTDVVLPRMAGPVVAERLTAIDPNVQVVYMSGYAEKHLIGVALGGMQFLAKPFRPAALAAAVEAALARSGPQGSGSKR